MSEKTDRLEMEMTLSWLDREREVWMASRVLAVTDPCGETLEAVKSSSMRLDFLLDELGLQIIPRQISL